MYYVILSFNDVDGSELYGEFSSQAAAAAWVDSLDGLGGRITRAEVTTLSVPFHLFS